MQSRDTHVLRVALGSVMRNLGVLSITVGDLDAAVSWLEGAEEREVRAGLLPALLVTRTDLARALLRRAGSTDRLRARKLVEKVARDAAEIGSQRDFRSETADLL